MIEPARLGWLAAILDIQGHVVQKRNQTRATSQVVVMVETRHRHVVTRLCAMTGTTAEMKQQSALPEAWRRRGCVEHCPDAHIHLLEEKPLPMISRWTVTGAAAAVVLHNVRPYLTSHMWDDEYEPAYDRVMADVKLTGQGSGATRSAIRRLLGLGWELPPGWLDAMIPGEDEEYSDDTEAILRLTGRKAITA